MSALPVERKTTREIIDQIMIDSANSTKISDLTALRTQIHSLVESLDSSTERMKFLKSRLQLSVPLNTSAPSQKTISLMIHRIRAAVNDLFRALEPSSPHPFLIQPKDHPLLYPSIEKMTQENLAEEIHELCQHNRFMTLNENEIATLWNWAHRQLDFQTLNRLLTAFKISPDQLSRTIDLTIELEQFNLISDPVIAFQYTHLHKTTRQQVDLWIQGSNRISFQEFLSETPHNSASEFRRLVATFKQFLQRNNIQLKSELPPIVGPDEEVIRESTRQMDLLIGFIPDQVMNLHPQGNQGPL